MRDALRSWICTVSSIAQASLVFKRAATTGLPRSDRSAGPAQRSHRTAGNWSRTPNGRTNHKRHTRRHDPLTQIRRPTGFAPLLARYSHLSEPQPAFLEVDEDGNVCIGWSRQIGDEVLEAVWRKQTLRWSVPYGPSEEQCDALLTKLEPLLESVHLGHDVDFDGTHATGSLDEYAKAASEAIEAICEDLKGYIRYCDAEWLGDDNEQFGPDDDTPLTAETTDAEIEIAADRLDVLAQGENIYIVNEDIVLFLKDRRERFREEEDENEV